MDRLGKVSKPKFALSKKYGGFGLPALSSLYKKLQVSCQCQLLMLQGPCMRFIAENKLHEEEKRCVVIHAGRSRRTLSKATKTRVTNMNETNMS